MTQDAVERVARAIREAADKPAECWEDTTDNYARAAIAELAEIFEGIRTKVRSEALSTEPGSFSRDLGVSVAHQYEDTAGHLRYLLEETDA